MDRLQTMNAFVRVVDHGGFTAAARALEVDQAVVTRQVADLERHLGVKLLERTTRSMRLTEAGEMFLARCREILSDVAEAEATINRSHQDIAGRVRMAVPTLFDMTWIAQQYANLHQTIPGMSLEIAFLDRPIDPVAEGFDVVIAEAAFGEPATAVASPLVELPLVLCAAPAYLQRCAQPEKPQDLLSLHCVAPWTSGEEGQALERWTLQDESGAQESVALRVALRTNTYAMTLEAVRCGVGVGRLTPPLASDDLITGRLVAVLPGWTAGRLAFNLVYPGHRMMPRRVRHLIDLIMAHRDAALTEAQSAVTP